MVTVPRMTASRAPPLRCPDRRLMSLSMESDILVMVNQSRRSDPACSFVTIAKTNDRYAAKARTRKIAAHTVCPWVRFAMKKNVVPTTGAAPAMNNQPHDRRANR